LTDAEPFRLSPRTFTAVATGDVSTHDLALLRSAQRSRLLLAVLALLAAPRQALGGGPPGAEAPTRPSTSWKLLADTQRAAPWAVDAVLTDPTVGTWAFQLLRRLDHGASAAPRDAPRWAGAALLGALAGAAALRAGTRATLRVPTRNGQLWLPSLGITGSVSRGAWPVVTMECGPRGATVYGDSGSIRLPTDLAQAADGWFPLPRLTRGGPAGTTPVTLDHLSPYRDFRTVGGPAQLSRQELRRWQSLVEESDALLRRDHPAARRLVNGAIHTIVPVDGPSELLAVSATAPDAYGAVTLSLPGDAQAMAATLIHEARHQILSALAELTPLSVPVPEGPQPVYFAPWRRDPRPLRGLLYGAHAFAGVMSYWHARRARDKERAEFEFALNRWQVRTALVALGSAPGLTRAGELILAGMRREFADVADEPVDGPAARLADLCRLDLRAAWRATHLTVDADEAAVLAGHWRAGHAPPTVLPAARLRTPRGGAPRASGPGAARMWLARLWLTDPGTFEDVQAQLAAGASHPLGIRDGTVADALLVSGETDAALAEYRRQPPSLAAWIGTALASTEPAASTFLERPELILALQAALTDLDVTTAGPDELAAWLNSRDPAAHDPRSDAEQIDVAVGPDPVDGILGGLVIGTQHPAE